MDHDHRRREHSASGAAALAVSVTANAAWTATNDVDWIAIASGSGGTGDGTVTYSVAANTGHLSRLGHVIVTDGERALRFRVNQVAADTVIISIAADPPAGGTMTGSGGYTLGQSVILKATAFVSHTFDGWFEGEHETSTNAVYTFAATSDRHLTARFRVRTFAVNYGTGAGGALVGDAAQTVEYGSNSTAVVVQPDPGALFHMWSDGKTHSPRTDTNVRSDLAVIASFRSTGGADLDWYAAHGISPGPGEDWSDVDARTVAGKGTTLLHENIADTDPDDPDDIFRVTEINTGPLKSVMFKPASTARFYTLQATTNLVTGAWANVPGQGPRFGAGSEDTMNDTDAAPARFYRVKAELP
ncbi:MAG: BACON domain-containing protein [Kiritimatiellae bacterium]|nr:BACON domain-containing protein [Kiritimatiellia bacterium]